MGADMLIQSIGFNAKTNNRFGIDEELARAAFWRARRTIKAINKKRLAAINHAQGSPYAGVQSCKHSLLTDVDEVEAAVLGSHRQAAFVEGGNGIILLLSGGMSWGDSPTELLDAMTRLLEADVIADARWPDTDHSHKPFTNK